MTLSQRIADWNDAQTQRDELGAWLDRACPGPYCSIASPHLAGSTGCAYRKPGRATIAARAAARQLPVKVYR